MSITVTSSRPAPRQSKPTDAPGEQLPTIPSPRDAMIRTVRNAAICNPLSPIEIAAALKYREQAIRLLTAAVLHNVQPIESSGTTPRTSGLLDYLAAQQKQTTPPEAQQKYRQARPGSFEAALEATDTFARQFEATYTLDGKLNLRAIGDLYDQTDGLEHPALGVLPPANTYSERDPRRDTIIHTDRLLRSIVHQAINPPQI